MAQSRAKPLPTLVIILFGVLAIVAMELVLVNLLPDLNKELRSFIVFGSGLGVAFALRERNRQIDSGKGDGST